MTSIRLYALRVASQCVFLAEGNVDGKLLLKFNQSLLGEWMCCVYEVHMKATSGGRRGFGF